MATYLRPHLGSLDYKTVQANLEKEFFDGAASTVSKEATNAYLKWNASDEDSQMPDIVSSAIDAIEKSFKQAKFTQYIIDRVKAQLPKDEAAAVDEHDERVIASMDAAMQIALGSGDTAKFAEAYAKAPMRPSAEVKPWGGELGSASKIDIEGFDSLKFDDYKVNAMLTASITAIASPFKSTFFRPVLLPANQPGVILSVQIPYIYRRTSIDQTGTAQTLPRRPLTLAAVDHTILAGNSLDVLPVYDTQRQANFVAELGQWPVEQHGATFNTGGLKFGNRVNLISLSSTEQLIKNGEMTERDTLDPNIILKNLFVSGKTPAGADPATDPAVYVDGIEILTETMSGATLTATTTGNPHDQQTTFEGHVTFASTDSTLTGATVADAFNTNLTSLSWLTTPYRVKVYFRISAKFDYNQGVSNMIVDLVETNLAAVEFGENFLTEATAAQLTEFNAALDVAVSAWYPGARRSNTSMRDMGDICDLGEQTQYLLTAPNGSVLSTTKPPFAMGRGMSTDQISALISTRNLGKAVSEIFEFEQRLRANVGIEGEAAAIGGIIINPTYKYSTLNCTTMVRNRDSRFGQQDLTAHIANAITMLANRMLEESHYLPVLQMYTTSRSAFEVAVVTSPFIANLIMRDGENRTMGNGRRFIVTAVDDYRMKDKIYISFVRTDTTEPDILSAGVHIQCPPMIQKAQISMAGGVEIQTQVIPRDNFMFLLPVLGRIDVTGVDTFYSQETVNASISVTP